MSHILLVEPDRLLAKVYSRALETDGHTVSTAATAQNAVFSADDKMPDVVLLELQLAGHSGIEFLYEFRTYPEWMKIPVVIVSHVPAHELHMSNSLLKEQLHVAEYYYKPQLRLSDLRRLVNELAPSDTIQE